MLEIAALIAYGTDGEKAIIHGFQRNAPMLYSLGTLFITKEILSNIGKNADVVQKVSSYFWKRYSANRKTRKSFVDL